MAPTRTSATPAPVLVAPVLVLVGLVRVHMVAPAVVPGAMRMGAVSMVLGLSVVVRVLASSGRWRLVGRRWVLVVLVGVAQMRRNQAKSKQSPVQLSAKATYAHSSAKHHSSCHQSSDTTSATNPPHTTQHHQHTTHKGMSARRTTLHANLSSAGAAGQARLPMPLPQLRP